MTTTTNTALGMLADIIEHPEDDDLRLIYADWLEDHGEEERAEFIRVQVELANLELAKVFLWHLENIEWRYLSGSFAHREWAADVVRILPLGICIPDAIVLRRGFVAEVHAPLAVLQQHLPALVRQHPIERVRATDKEPEFFEDLSNPWTWWRHGDRAGSIGSGLWAKLDGHVVDAVDSVSSGKDYPTAEAAHDALSVALLKLVRG